MTNSSIYRRSVINALISGAPPADIIVADAKRPLPTILREEAHKAKLRADQKGVRLWGQIVLSDAGSQNAINQIGGEGVGDQNLNAYWDLISNALGAVRRSVERQNRLKVDEDKVELHFVSTIRRARSDEGKLIVLASSKNDHEIVEELSKTEIRMKSALKIFRKILYGEELPREIEFGIDREQAPKLEDYQISTDTGWGLGYGDLRTFGGLMRHIETIAAVSIECGSPFHIGEDLEVVERNIAMVEAGEIKFLGRLPSNLRIFRTVSSVQSPFPQKLDELEGFGPERKIDEGHYVQIRFAISDEDSRKLRNYIFDNWDNRGSKGTRKGHAEIYGHNEDGKKLLGMRGLNTFLGKDSADTLITIAAKAMKKVSDELDVSIFPVGNNLRYHIAAKEGLDQETLAKKVKEMVDFQIGQYSKDLGFEAHIQAIDARECTIGEIAQTFELLSMSRESDGIEILRRANLIVSVIEKVKIETLTNILEKEIYDDEERAAAIATLKTLIKIFEMRRTLRDASDLVAVIRNDDELEIDKIYSQENVDKRTINEKIETEFFDLVKKYGEVITNEIRKIIVSSD